MLSPSRLLPLLSTTIRTMQASLLKEPRCTYGSPMSPKAPRHTKEKRAQAYLIPPHIVVADVPVSAAEQIQRAIVKHGRVKRTSGGTSVAAVHPESCPEGRLTVVHIKVGQSTEFSRESSPEIDIAPYRIEAAAVCYPCFREIALASRRRVRFRGG